MRQVSLANYTARVPNNQRIARFKAAKCVCSLELEMADPVNPKVLGPNILSGECPGCGLVQPMDIPDHINLLYDTKDSMIEMLLSRQNQMGATELLERDVIARKILVCTDGTITLEEEEWKKLTKAANTVKGLGKADIQCVRQILEAEKIQA